MVEIYPQTNFTFHTIAFSVVLAQKWHPKKLPEIFFICKIQFVHANKDGIASSVLRSCLFTSTSMEVQRDTTVILRTRSG